MDKLLNMLRGHVHESSYLLHVHHHEALYFWVFLFIKSAVCERLRLRLDSVRHAGWSSPWRGLDCGICCLPEIGILDVLWSPEAGSDFPDTLWAL